MTMLQLIFYSNICIIAVHSTEDVTFNTHQVKQKQHPPVNTDLVRKALTLFSPEISYSLLPSHKFPSHSSKKVFRRKSLKGDQVKCRSTIKGAEYNGMIAQDKYGRTCRAWSETEYSNDIRADSNYCRNMGNDHDGPWCYTWDHGWYESNCNIPYCKMKFSTTNIDNFRQECKSTPNGLEYNGTVSEGEHLGECIPWSVTEYRDNSKAENNYCRNMDNDNFGPWCYYYNSDQSQRTYCDIPHCADLIDNNTECRRTPSGGKYAGTMS